MMKALNFKVIVRSNRFEYFYYFILTSLLITFVLGGSLYLYFSSVLKNETIQANDNALTQLKNSEEFILSEVDKSFINVLMDPFIVSYMDYFKTGDMVILSSIQSKLQNVVTSNEYIDSVYVYYLQSNVVLSSNQGYVPEGQFYDNHFLKDVMKKDLSKSIVYTRNMRDYYSKDNITVISIIKTIPINLIGNPNAVVIINVKAKYLQRIIDSIKVKKESAIVITNNTGNIISQNNNIDFLNQQNITDFIDLKNNTSVYSYSKDIDGRKMIVSTLYSDKYEWKYLYIVPMSVVTESIRFLGGITVLFCLMVIMLSFIGSFFLSRKLYSPIKTMMGLLSSEDKSCLNSESREINETSIIQTNIRSLINRNRGLEELLGDYEIYQKNMMLKGILDGSDSAAINKVNERLKYYDIDLDEDGYFIAYVISMDNYQEIINLYSEKQRNIVLMYVNKAISDMVFKQYNGFMVTSNPNEVTLIINLHKENDKAKAIYYRLGSEIHEIASKNVNQTFTIGVSLLHRGISEISNCYREALSALNYRMLFDRNQVILYESVESGERVKVDYPFFIEKDIINSLKLRDHEKISSLLDAFGDYFYNNLPENLNLIQNYFLQLLSSSVKCIYDMDPDCAFNCLSENDIYSALLKEETMKGMAGQIAVFYNLVLTYLEEKRDIRSSELVMSIIKYIENNLGADLSIERLSELFYISTSYIRKTFKDKTNTTIKEFTNELRMAKAKELLRGQSRRIGDIATDIGYMSVQAFTTAFKLYTGKTPGEYRMSVARQKFENMVKRAET